MNKYMNVKRLEFSVTYKCTGRCKHCSVGDKRLKYSSDIDKSSAGRAVGELNAVYPLESVMTFGGEPLLCLDTVCAVHSAARDCGIAQRQLITNGFFSRSSDEIIRTAKLLSLSGVNDILLSVDAFHAEEIPLSIVFHFAEALKELDFCRLRLHPSWLVNKQSDNEYNRKTKKCLSYFEGLNLEISDGNDIFLCGNAKTNFARFYDKKTFDKDFRCGDAPYTDSLANISCISIEPDGDVIACVIPIGNIREKSISDIIKDYNPQAIPVANALLLGGISQLLCLAESKNIKINPNDFYTPCDICRHICERLL